MEKFLLGTFFSYDELYVVNKEYIDIPVFLPEFGHTGIISVTDGIDQLVGKYFRCYVENFFGSVSLQDIMCYRMHKVGFAQSHVSVQEQRIVFFARRLRHSHGSSVCKPVVAADDKGFKGIFWIQVCILTVGLSG